MNEKNNLFIDFFDCISTIEENEKKANSILNSLYNHELFQNAIISNKLVKRDSLLSNENFLKLVLSDLFKKLIESVDLKKIKFHLNGEIDYINLCNLVNDDYFIYNYLKGKIIDMIKDEDSFEMVSEWV